MENMLHGFVIIFCVMMVGIFLTESYWFRKLTNEKIRILTVVVMVTIVVILGFEMLADKVNFGCLQDHMLNLGGMLVAIGFLSAYILGRGDMHRQIHEQWLRNRGLSRPAKATGEGK